MQGALTVTTTKTTTKTATAPTKAPATLTIGQIAAAIGVPAPRISQLVYREAVPGLTPRTCPVGPDRRRLVPAELVPAIDAYFRGLAEARANKD
jgi:hypothetical protein